MTMVSQPAGDPMIENRSLKIAIVSRRFWPFSGTTEFAVSDLALAIKKAGHEVEILTVRWEKSWPSYFDYQEIPIRRVSRSASAPWSSFRYLRNLQRQIHEVNPDGIIVFGIGEETWSISKSFGSRTPFVIRLDNHAFGVRPGRPNLSSRQIGSLKNAERIIAESDWTSERLKDHPGLEQAQVEVVPDPIALDCVDENLSGKTPASKATARNSISDAHPVLMIEPTQPLVICGSPMNGDVGLIDLVNAWPRVLKQYPKARLWIVGEGVKSRMVWEKIVELNLVHTVIMPGSFDELEDVFHAADLYVHPLRSDQSCSFLTRAMCNGVCSVVTKTKATVSIVEGNTNGLVVLPESPQALAEAIIYGLGSVDLRDRLGRAALKSASKAYDASKHVGKFLAPLLAGSARNRDD